MKQVLLYPKRGGTGGGNQAEPWYFPEKIAQKLVNNGMWSTVPDVSNPSVANDLIEKAQTQVLMEKAQIARERAEMLKLKEEVEALKAQLDGSKKVGRPKAVEV